MAIANRRQRPCACACIRAVVFPVKLASNQFRAILTDVLLKVFIICFWACPFLTFLVFVLLVYEDLYLHLRIRCTSGRSSSIKASPLSKDPCPHYPNRKGQIETYQLSAHEQMSRYMLTQHGVYSPSGMLRKIHTLKPFCPRQRRIPGSLSRKSHLQLLDHGAGRVASLTVRYTAKEAWNLAHHKPHTLAGTYEVTNSYDATRVQG